MTIVLDWGIGGLALFAGVMGMVSHVVGQVGFTIFWLTFCLVLLCLFTWPIIGGIVI